MLNTSAMAMLWRCADIEQKIKLAYSTENKASSDGLAAKVLSIVDKEHGETLGCYLQSLEKYTKNSG